MQLIEDKLPVEYYHQLAGVMVDSAIILEKVEKIYKDLYKYMKSQGFDIMLNNLIFRLLMSLFIENTHKCIYLPIIDCLFLFNEIYLHKACLILLSLLREDIFKCKDLADASNLFDVKLLNFYYNKFAYQLINSDFELKMDIINKQRKEKLPKILENIQKMSKNSKKSKPAKNDNFCDLDWPYCVKTIQEPVVNDILKYKLFENILIENNYFDLSHNVYKLNETSEETREKEFKKENDERRKKTLIYGNLLMERPIHKCESNFSSREKILGDQSRRKSSLMNVFFEQTEKVKEKDFDSNSSELMEMIHNRSDYLSDVNRSFLIESVIDLPKDEEEKEKEKENEKENDEKDDENEDYINKIEETKAEQNDENENNKIKIDN